MLVHKNGYNLEFDATGEILSRVSEHPIRATLLKDTRGF